MTSNIKQLDPVQGLVDYIEDIKPYHTKVIEVLTEYVYNEAVDITITDRLEMEVGLAYPGPQEFNDSFDALCGYGQQPWGGFEAWPVIPENPSLVNGPFVDAPLGYDPLAGTFTLPGDRTNQYFVGAEVTVDLYAIDPGTGVRTPGLQTQYVIQDTFFKSYGGLNDVRNTPATIITVSGLLDPTAVLPPLVGDQVYAAEVTHNGLLIESVIPYSNTDYVFYTDVPPGPDPLPTPTIGSLGQEPDENIGAEIYSNAFVLDGDVASFFTRGFKFTVDSGTAEGVWTVKYSVYDDVADKTYVRVDETINTNVPFVGGTANEIFYGYDHVCIDHRNIPVGRVQMGITDNVVWSWDDTGGDVIDGCQYVIQSADGNTFLVNGDATRLVDGQQIRVLETPSNNGIYEVSGTPVFDGQYTQVTITGLLTTEDPSGGWLECANTITLPAPSILTFTQTAPGSCVWSAPDTDCQATSSYQVTFVPNDVPGNMSVTWTPSAGSIVNQVDDFGTNTSTVDVVTTSATDVAFNLTVIVSNSGGSDSATQPYVNAHDEAPPELTAILVDQEQFVICGTSTEAEVVLLDQLGNVITDFTPFNITWSFVSGDPLTIVTPNAPVTDVLLQAQPATFSVIQVEVEDVFNATTFTETVEILRIPQSTHAGAPMDDGNSTINLTVAGQGGTPATNALKQPSGLLVTPVTLDGSGEPIAQTEPCRTPPDPNFVQIFWNWPPQITTVADPSEVGYLGTNVYRVEGDNFVLVEFIPGKDRNYTTVPSTPAIYTVAGVWREIGLGAPRLQFATERVRVGAINTSETVINTSRTALIPGEGTNITQFNRTNVGVIVELATDDTAGSVMGEGVNLTVAPADTKSQVTILPQVQVQDPEPTAGTVMGEGVNITDVFIERLNGTNIGGP